MKGPNQKWLSTGRLRRTILMLGVAGATAGAALLTTAGSAQAVTSVGSEPGNLTFSPASGSATASGSSITWSTKDACPAGFQGSAFLEIIDSNGTGSIASPVVSAVTAPFSGTLAQTPAQAQSLGTSIPFGQPVEWAVECFSAGAGTGSGEFVQSTDMTITSATGTYTTGIATVTGTSTTLAASPNPANAGGSVTLTAVETATDGTHPAGSVTFMNGSTAINSTPIAVDATGTATTTTSFPSAGTFPLTAVFTPSNSASFGGSTSPVVNESVNPSGSLNAGGSNPIPISVTVAPSGTLTVTVAANTGVALTVNGLVATGSLPNVTVTDTRNTFPGWSVSGIQSVFQGQAPISSSTISASQLGWAPAAVGTLTGGATAGPTVAPGTTPGLASASVLGSAPHGQGAGTNVFTAALTLDIPPTAAAGTYTGNMTITYLSSN
jgi:hypothetical protein